jgi:hypothetical protein
MSWNKSYRIGRVDGHAASIWLRDFIFCLGELVFLFGANKTAYKRDTFSRGKVKRKKRRSAIVQPLQIYKIANSPAARSPDPRGGKRIVHEEGAEVCGIGVKQITRVAGFLEFGGALKLLRCHTHFFSLGGFEFDAASPRAVLGSDRLKSELPASASYEARPSNFRGIDF